MQVPMRESAQIARKTFRGLHLPAAGERAPERDLVRVLEVAADGQSAREPRHAHAVSKAVGEVRGRRFSGHRRVGREDDLLDLAALQPREQSADPQIRRLDAVDRRQRASEDVVEAAELAVRSSEMTSTGCSTTQITVRSRRGSAQTGTAPPR